MVNTHKPSGLPSWPILLLAGGEKCGKSYAAAEFSGSDLIDRTFWIEIGEMIAEEYGKMPGARYEIVDHDGTYSKIMDETESILAEPRGKKPHALVVDSMTKMWDLLTEEQETIMKKRNKSVITTEQWVAAKKKWARFLDLLRKFDGPVILTARYEQVAVMDARGVPTGTKEWKIKAEKNLGYDVSGTITIPNPRDYFLSGITSLAYDIPVGGNKPLPGFTLDRFIRTLGIDGQAVPRSYVALTEEVKETDQSGRVTFDQLEGKEKGVAT